MNIETSIEYMYTSTGWVRQGSPVVDHLVRYQVRLDPREGERVKSWAYAQGKSLSAALAHLVGRGLDFESGHSPAYLARVISSQGEMMDHLDARLGGLEWNEAERFQLVLGHMRLHQRISTEMVHLVRELYLCMHENHHLRKVMERVRTEIEEDAKVYKSSTDSAGVSQRSEDNEAVEY